MTEYTALVTVSRKADGVHTKIEFGDSECIEVNMLIALEFLKIALNDAEETGVLVKPFKKSIKSMLKDFVNTDVGEREEWLDEFVAINDILGEEEQE